MTREVDAEAVGRVREYYRALDEHDYEALSALLTPEFVHERPDRTLEGRDRFVRFMREERPQSDTSHPVDGVYVAGDSTAGGDGTEGDGRGSGERADGGDLAVRGRLLAASGDPITAFVDVFTLEDGRIARVDTFTR